MQRSTPLAATLLALALLSGTVLWSCGGDAPQAPAPQPTTVEPDAPAEVNDFGPAQPLPALILTQARFDKIGGKVKPRPATLWLWRKGPDGWHQSLVEDPTSNVFHKGMWWNGGILTIGAVGARLTHWVHEGSTWTPTLIWSQSWGGKFDRLRDIEIADLTGDGKDDLVIATHDQGVVAVGKSREGGFDFVEMDQTPDTFVHEIEIGDVDGDGVKEFYATPSDRNKSSGVSQKGAVVRYDLVGESFVRSPVVAWEESHAKEILVANVDGVGADELYAVREAHVVKNAAGQKERLDPVRIVQLIKDPSGWTEKIVATLEDDMCRFLLVTDANHDGHLDLVAAGKTSGLWLLERQPDGTFSTTSIDRDSGGFEHATHAADLDGDGKDELYVASDDQGELRSYVWDGAKFAKTVLGPIPPRTLTWNIQDGTF